MGRRRLYNNIKLPGEVVDVVKSLIAEEERERKLGLSTDFGVKTALAMGIADSAHERKVAMILVDDIAKGKGYNTSQLSLFMDLKTYYLRKRKYIYDVALALGLITS
jgi:hypothetical protein